MTFNERINTLLKTPAMPLTWDSILKECTRIENDHAHIRSEFQWALEYKRFQVEDSRGNRVAGLIALKAAIAAAPENADILGDYKNYVRKAAAFENIVLIISSKKNEAKAIQLGWSFDKSNIQYLIVSGSDTAPIEHIRALQVDVPDNYESRPRKVAAALAWIYENMSNVGVLKIDDDMSMSNARKLQESLKHFHAENAYAGVPVSISKFDRCAHWGLCQDAALNRRVYGRPVLRPWAAGSVYYLGAGMVEKIVCLLMRFPAMFDGEFYEDKLIGDVLLSEGVELSSVGGYADFGFTVGGTGAASILQTPRSALKIVAAPAAPAAPPRRKAVPVLAAGQPLYLHLGCGTKNFPGFINIDLDTPAADMHLDLTGPLPWEDRTVAGIFSEHFIEHITQAQGIRLLMECRRTLLPGGVLRVATPDLAETVRHYNENYLHPDLVTHDLAWTENRCERMNIAMRWWGHQWLYDEDELVHLGKLVGLNVRGRFELGESSEPMLAGREYRESSTLIIEFEKPERQVKADENPLVSIVIPAYNPRYFRASLECAINQTYQNLDILVCDDSLADGILDIVKEYQEKDDRIRYLRNTIKTDVPGRPNHILCFNEARGDFIKFLNDDDLLAPHCVERLLNCFIENPDLVLATSKRQRIDAAGNHLPDTAVTQSPFQQDTLIDGLKLGVALITTKLNFVGEPTTALFRRSELVDVKPDFGSIDKLEVSGMFDVAVWLNLLRRGNALYVVEPLSYFRIHDEQAQVVYADACQAGAKEGWNVAEKAWRRFGFLT